MTRIIDADALVAQIEKECCINCVHRKGSSGRYIYDIGDAPCKACGVHDAVDWIENADEIDAMPIVRCKDCKHFAGEGMYCACNIMVNYDHFYCYNAEREDDELQTD